MKIGLLNFVTSESTIFQINFSVSPKFFFITERDTIKDGQKMNALVVLTRLSLLYTVHYKQV